MNKPLNSTNISSTAITQIQIMNFKFNMKGFNKLLVKINFKCKS